VQAIDLRAAARYGSRLRRAGRGDLTLFRAAQPNPHVLVETGMTTFDDREKAFERKFALDQELKFRAESRRNKALAEWAAGRLGLAGADLDEYVKAVRRADLAEKGDEDVFRKIRKDFDAKGVTVSDAELRKQMGDLLAQAVREIEATRS
jgi:hypothetical protein